MDKSLRTHQAKKQQEPVRRLLSTPCTLLRTRMSHLSGSARKAKGRDRRGGGGGHKAKFFERSGWRFLVYRKSETLFFFLQRKSSGKVEEGKGATSWHAFVSASRGGIFCFFRWVRPESLLCVDPQRGRGGDLKHFERLEKRKKKERFGTCVIIVFCFFSSVFFVPLEHSDFSLLVPSQQPLGTCEYCTVHTRLNLPHLTFLTLSSSFSPPLIAASLFFLLLLSSFFCLPWSP